jgi:hypothetical protein
VLQLANREAAKVIENESILDSEKRIISIFEQKLEVEGIWDIYAKFLNDRKSHAADNSEQVKEISKIFTCQKKFVHRKLFDVLKRAFDAKKCSEKMFSLWIGQLENSKEAEKISVLATENFPNSVELWSLRLKFP